MTITFQALVDCNNAVAASALRRAREGFALLDDLGELLRPREASKPAASQAAPIRVALVSTARARGR